MGCGEVQACCSGLEGRMGKTGILLLNTGSPVAPTSEAAASYLRSFLSDPRICPMNPHVWSFVLKRFIIPKRAPVSAGKYASIWTEAGSRCDNGIPCGQARSDAKCCWHGRSGEPCYELREPFCR